MNEGHDQFCKLPPNQTWIWGLTNGWTPILRGINFPRQVEDHDPPEMATWSKVCCLSLPIQRNCPWQPMLRGASVATAPQHLEQVFSEPSGSLFPESPFDLFKPKKKNIMKTKVVIIWDNSITAFVSFWGLPNQTAHPQTNLQLENVVKKNSKNNTGNEGKTVWHKFW